MHAIPFHQKDIIFYFKIFLLDICSMITYYEILSIKNANYSCRIELIKQLKN